MAASSQRSINRLSDFHSSHAAPTIPLRSQASTTVLVAKLQPGNRENPRFYLPTHVSSHDRGRGNKQQITEDRDRTGVISMSNSVPRRQSRSSGASFHDSSVTSQWSWANRLDSGLRRNDEQTNRPSFQRKLESSPVCEEGVTPIYW